jgi:ATP-dependent helicase/nuclease subunit A
MPLNYLDTDKSIMISSPAGSGKTEKLARRYIALLQKGVDIERILAITFTEKAATEMKQRILRILKDEDRALFKHLLEKMPLMRVSTIHAFCGTLLRRFSFEAGIDPNYKIEDAIDSYMTWEEIFFELLMDAGRTQQRDDLLLQTLSEKGFGGLNYLRNTLEYLLQKTPFSLDARIFHHIPVSDEALIEELKSWPGIKEAIDGYERLFGKDSSVDIASFERYFLKESNKEPRRRPPQGLKNIPGYQDWASKMYLYWKDKKIEEYIRRTERIGDIFKKCIDRYTENKKAKGILNFSDLEYLTYRMLTDNPEWANILYAFDERTDHILVDEFQDTNTFQWAIINKLTEEWRAGLGAKRETGTRPTVFFVGDEKQSIYYFRGANVEIFQRARQHLQTWLGDEFEYEEAKENYRSRPVIIDFTNHLFSRLMQAHDSSPAWVTRYSDFRAFRTSVPDKGRVEIIILHEEEGKKIQEIKQKEADILAQRIQGLIGNFQITDRDAQHHRPCMYSDIAILLRKRTHLKKYEEALRQYNIPFVVVKGIGFYQEPEVAMLRALVFFLSNPGDDYSLYVLLKSPLFRMDESTIIQIINSEGDCLFSKLLNLSSESSSNLSCNIEETANILQDWLSQLPNTPLSELIESALVRTKAWRYFHEPQRRANIKKFIRIVEDMEANGRSLIRIRDFLERTYNKSEEPKANVNTEGMNAVKIMTIHAAKGLEFPVVFIPGLEESFTTTTGENLIYEKDGKFFFKSEPEPSIRRQDEDFREHRAKEEEEQKRLFYVAVTRAEEALFLIGTWNDKNNSFLAFLKQGIGLNKHNTSYIADTDIPGLSIITEEDVKMLYKHAPKQETSKTACRPMEVIPLTIRQPVSWKAVTETADIRRQHGKDWLILGDIMHRIFEAVSKGVIHEQDIKIKAEKLLKAKGIFKRQLEENISIIEKDISRLKKTGIWQDIIMPRRDAFSELPFIYESEGTVYTGRIDRIIKDANNYRIYDYKTFPVKEKEIGYLLKEYSFQMKIYKRAVMKIFNTKNVKSFIVFTHIGEIKEVV